MATIVDPVSSRLRAALDEVYGERIERVALFGSRARGEARLDSQLTPSRPRRGSASRPAAREGVDWKV
jgi:hypothetical protein